MTAAPASAIDESRRRIKLARDMIAVHGSEAAQMARENARLTAVAGQAAQARDWLRTLEIIQRLSGPDRPMKGQPEQKNRATLPPAFSLLRSEFGDFLYAPIDAGDVRPLTVLSVLTREGIDPWREAARLCQLPHDAARRDLAAVIATLPEGQQSIDDALTIAGRLIALLPRRPSVGARLAGATRGFRTRLLRPLGS